jgi:phage terminase small subunit
MSTRRKKPKKVTDLPQQNGPSEKVPFPTYARLTPKQQAFVQAFIRTRNASEAARTAGYSKSSARNYGQALLKNKNVLRAIEELAPPLNGEVARKVDEFLLRVLEIPFDEARVKMTDRLKAAELLARRFGLFIAPAPQLPKQDEEEKDAQAQLEEILKTEPAPFTVVKGGKE